MATAGPENSSHPACSGSTIQLVASDGHRLAAYRAHPDGESRAGLVVLQEIFGVNKHIRELCDRYAASGFMAVAPSLFDRAERDIDMGYDADAVETGRRLRAAIGWDASLLDVQAAIDEASAAGPVVVLGFCWGGTLAFLAATRLKGVSCAVSYYGGQTVPFAQEPIRVPVIMHFGEFDPRIPESDREVIQKGNPAIEMHVFPADHGFNCDHRKEFDADCAERAQALTNDFINRNLKPKG